ncbi:HNH endonuclease [bacterium]|nr:HNH endonuclease [bacterium]
MPTATKNATRQERHNAGSLLAYAIKTGKIEKPETCEACGKNVGAENIQGHHIDYEHPYEVKWLCGKCHRDLHRQLRNLYKIDRDIFQNL